MSNGKFSIRIVSCIIDMPQYASYSDSNIMRALQRKTWNQFQHGSNLPSLFLNPLRRVHMSISKSLLVLTMKGLIL
jgi:hypothetical protein